MQQKPLTAKLNTLSHEILVFGRKQVRSCVFAGSFFVLLIASNYISIPGVARYDFLFIGAILIQVLLVVTKLETWREVRVIAIFHLVGLVLELFKTSPGIAEWSYPEEGFFMIATVPLYSGFMYAAVGSYMSQAWEVFNLKLKNFPSFFLSLPLLGAIYLNFFTRHYLPDIRYILILIVILVFYKTRVYFTPVKARRSMPLVLSFVLIGFFIWIAENISTFFNAWQYPSQAESWTAVDLSRISSWFLLAIISFVIVANLKHVEKAS